MKKIIAIAAMLLMTATAVNAQFKFGVKAGAEITTMSISSDVLNSSNRTGFYVGPTMKVNVPVVGLGLDLSALYDQREVSINKANGESETVKNQTIAIPLNVRYTVIGMESIINVYAYTGPQIAFNVGSKKILDGTGSYKSSYYSWNLGLGAMIASHLQLNANYNIALGKTGDVQESSVAGNVTDAVSSVFSSSNNNSWQIGLAYYF